MSFHTSSGFYNSNNRDCQSFFKLNNGIYKNKTKQNKNNNKKIRLVVILFCKCLVDET